MFDKTKVFSFTNAVLAKKFEGEYGFFANSINDLKCNIKDNFYKKLNLVIDDNNCDIQNVFSSDDDEFYGLFYPLKYVTKKPVEIYRPFTDIEELKKVTELDVGSIVTMRYVYDPNNEFKALITAIDNKGLQISTTYCTIYELYKLYEYHFKDNWFKFGIKEYR